MTSEERFERCCKIYRENREFKNFIFRLKRPGKQWNGFEVEELLKMKTIQDIGEYYLKKCEGKKDCDSSPVSPMFLEEEDKSC
jgi:hypothetical protein